MGKRKATSTPKRAKKGKMECKETDSSDVSTLLPANDGAQTTQSISVGEENIEKQQTSPPEQNMAPELTETAPATPGVDPDPTATEQHEKDNPMSTAPKKEPEDKEQSELAINQLPETTDDAEPPYRAPGPPEINPINDTTYPPYVSPFNERTEPIDMDVAEKKLRVLSVHIEMWAKAYTYKEMEGIDELVSAQDRQGILDYLDTYCLYKDWDTMVENLGHLSLRYFPRLLAEAVMGKTLFETIIQNPFFYIRSDDNDEASVAAGSLPKFGQDLFQLSQKLNRASDAYAARWRLIMVRFLHAFSDNETNDGSVGIETGRWRDPIIQRLVTDMLKPSSPLYPLLRKLDDPKEIEDRYLYLLKIYRTAGNLSVWFGINPCTYDFRHSIKEYSPYSKRKDRPFNADSTSLSEGFDSPEGRIPMLIMRPEIKTRFFEYIPADMGHWRGCHEWEAHEWETGCSGRVVLQTGLKSSDNTS